MKRMNLRRSVLCLNMLIAIVLQLIYFSYTLYSNGYLFTESSEDVLSSITTLFGMSGFIYFAPVFPALPFAFSYLEDKNSGFIHYMIVRMGRKKYIVQKLFWTGLSGGIASSFPVFCAFVYLILTQKPSVSDVNSMYYPYMFEGMNWEPYLGVWGGCFVLLIKLILVFLFGVFWAEATMLVSLLIANKYIVFVIPTAVYLIMWMVSPPKPFFNLQWIVLYRGDYWSEYPIWFGHMIQGINIMIILILNVLLFRRRLSDE